MSELSAMGQKALQLVGMGYRVFPLVPGDKTPIVANGFKDATDDRVQVCTWWTEYPKANIGIATGGDLVVIDVDRLPKDGVKKFLPNPWIEPVSEKLESLSADHVVQSPTGGFHLYYRTNRALRCSQGDIAEGVDVRANGGYIVAPGSEIDGRQYRELEGRSLVDVKDLPWLPAVLCKEFDRLETERARSKAPKASQTPRNKIRVIEEGQRHQALVKEAARLRGLGLGPEALSAELHRFNRERCSPPQDAEDVDRIARDYSDKDANEQWSLKICNASEIEQEPVEWLIGHRIMRGALNTIVGLPGSGKSLLTTFLASKVSTGRGLSADKEQWPERAPANVVMFTFEDGMGQFVRPRLERMGADLERVKVCDSMQRGEQERGVDLLRDLPAIEDAILEHRPALLIIDPVNSAWASGKDQNDDVQVREVLSPLKRLATEHDVAIILVTHTNKRSDVSDAQDAASGARGIVGLARATYLAGVLEEEDGSKTHYLCDLKVNVRAPAEALKFRVRADSASAPDAWVEILGTEPMSATEFLREKSRRAKDARNAKEDSKLKEAKDAAIEILNANGGRMLSQMLLDLMVDKRGFAKKTSQSALKELRSAGTIGTGKERIRNGKHWTYYPDSIPPELREHPEDREEGKAG